MGRKLGKCMAYQRMIASISTSAATFENLEEFQSECLGLVGKALDIEEAYIFRCDADKDTIINTFYWSANDESQPSLTKNMPACLHRCCAALLRQGEILSSSDVEIMPSEVYKNQLQRQGIKSFLAVSLSAAGQLPRVMAFIDGKNQRDWQDEETVAVRAAACIIANALRRRHSEQELERERHLTQTILDHVPAGIAFLDNDLVVRRFNRVYGEYIDAYTTFAASEAVGSSYLDLIQGINPHVIQFLESVRDSGEAQNSHEIEVTLHRNGKEIKTYWDSSVIPLRNPFGEPEGVAILTRDVTDRKQFEDATCYRLKIEKALAEVSKRLVTIRDADLNEILRILGEVVDANRAYIFQLREDGIAMDNTHEWCCPDTEPEIHNLQNQKLSAFPWWMKKLRNGENIVIEDVDKLPDEAAPEKEILKFQSIRSLIAVPINTRDGELIGFMGFDDVRKCRTWSDDDARLLRMASEMIDSYLERQKAEEALERHKERLNLVVENTPGCFFYITDEKGNFTYISPSVEAITGQTVDKWMNGSGSFLTDSLANQKSYGRLKRARQKGKERLSVTYETLHKSGEKLTLEVHERPIVREGKTVGYQGVVRDVTEQKRIEAQLRQSQKINAVGRLAGGIAHDFKNLLMGISGHAEMLRLELSLTDRESEDVENILGCTDIASKLVHQLLAFSQGQEMDPRPMNLNELVGSFEQLLTRSLGKHTPIKLELSPDVGIVNIDPVQMEQVLLNLAINARDAMPEGGELRISTCNYHIGPDSHESAWMEEGDYAMLCVSDTGIGMDHKTKDRLFEPFFTTKRDAGNAGLGLPLVYRIVRQHKGDIQVLSEPDMGTTLQIFLPVVKT